jgi:hypothetical protein
MNAAYLFTFTCTAKPTQEKRSSPIDEMTTPVLMMITEHSRKSEDFSLPTVKYNSCRGNGFIALIIWM